MSNPVSPAPALDSKMVSIPKDLFDSFLKFKSISDDFLGLSDSPVYCINRLIKSWIKDAKLYENSIDMECLLTSMRLVEFFYDLRIGRDELEWYRDEADKMMEGGRDNE